MTEFSGKETVYKIVLVGNSSCGKTSILLRFAEAAFYESHRATIGIDCKEKVIEQNNKNTKLQIWDTAGQEKFRLVSKMYYRNADGIIAVFDLTNKVSFDDLIEWINEARENCDNQNIPVIIVGNKSDLENRIITCDDLKSFSEISPLKYFECSAKLNWNIDEIFFGMSRLINSGKEQSENATSENQSNAEIAKETKKLDKKKPSKKKCCN